MPGQIKRITAEELYKQLKSEQPPRLLDMVDSTPMLFRHSTERVLEIVQSFMAAVVDVAVHHCGDVHDFEGDGAMLYFAGAGEAVPAEVRNCA